VIHQTALLKQEPADRRQKARWVVPLASAFSDCSNIRSISRLPRAAPCHRRRLARDHELPVLVDGDDRLPVRVEKRGPTIRLW